MVPTNFDGIGSRETLGVIVDFLTEPSQVWLASA
jgi:hypothetical protein